MDHLQQFIAAYKRLAMEKGSLPVSKHEIAAAADLSEAEFSAAFASLEALQDAVWTGYLRSTMEALENSTEYAQYSVREKMLAFYFTLFEHLGADRPFIKLFGTKLGIWNYNPSFLVGFKSAFLKFVDELIKEGLESKEIEERLMLGGEYGGWHWPQILFLINKWIEDESEAHVVSDQAIEKSVNLGFDIMGRNVMDSAVDFAKFMIAGR